MHSFQFHIKDYISHTRHLTLMEDLAYRRLLDLYYMSDGVLVGTRDSVARQIAMPEHEEDVGCVLAEFFDRDDDDDPECPCWSNTRADQEIQRYRDRVSSASAAGRASAAKRSFNHRSTQSGPTPVERPSTNHEPVTKNHEPVTKNHEPVQKQSERAKKPEDVSPELWRSFLANRNAKKKPLTPLAWTRLENRIKKAGVSVSQALSQAIDNGWADWDPSWNRGSGTPTGASGRPLAKASTIHIPNMPLGHPSCQCQGCVEKRKG